MQDDWNPDWQSTSSSKVTYLVHQLKQLQERNMMIEHSTENRDVMPSDSSFSSKISYFNTLPEQEACYNSRNGWCRNGLEKAIVFSQFLEHIHVIEQQVTFDWTFTHISYLVLSQLNNMILIKKNAVKHCRNSICWNVQSNALLQQGIFEFALNFYESLAACFWFLLTCSLFFISDEITSNFPAGSKLYGTLDGWKCSFGS